jgi:hypothetical protein
MNIKVDVAVPDAAMPFLDADIRRVFFIANNGEIEKSVFEKCAPGPTDVVVQYNKPIFFDTLSAYKCHKLHFFYPNHLNSCWGFTADGTPEVDYSAQQSCSLTFAVANVIPNMIDPYCQSLGDRVPRMALVLDRHVPLHNYPVGRMPSSGFITIRFFRFLSWLRTRQNRPGLQLIPIGFTGRYSAGTGWNGHDFEFEQKVYDTWLDLQRLSADGTAIRQPQDGQ